jgi:uncharacterized protein involved in response to NO
VWRAPVWRSGFRPFFLAGALYGPLALVIWLCAYAGALTGAGAFASPLWHGHEMVFGFVAAIVCGLLLTALPSWAGIPEQHGGTLALLTAVWIAGRIAMAFVAAWPPVLVAALDVAALALLAILLAPPLLHARLRKFTVVLPVLAALVAANTAFHIALALDDRAAASTALTAAVAIVVVLYSLVGGFMTPVFTNNALREQGSPHRAWRSRRLDLAAHGLAIAFALSQCLAAAAPVAAGVAAAACIVHGIRLAGWRGWHVRGNLLVVAMHAGYAWLVLAFALAAAARLGFGIGPRDWLHAATIGAIGLMMLALMPRVSLRHTGRALAVHRLLAAAYVAMTGAALLRLAFGLLGGPLWIAVAAALLWSACFVAYLIVYAPMLLRASVPRSSPGTAIS